MRLVQGFEVMADGVRVVGRTLNEFVAGARILGYEPVELNHPNRIGIRRTQGDPGPPLVLPRAHWQTVYGEMPGIRHFRRLVTRVTHG